MVGQSFVEVTWVGFVRSKLWEASSEMGLSTFGGGDAFHTDCSLCNFLLALSAAATQKSTSLGSLNGCGGPRLVSRIAIETAWVCQKSVSLAIAPARKLLL